MARLMDKLFSLTHEIHDIKKQVISSSPCNPAFVAEIDTLMLKTCSLYSRATDLDQAIVINGYVRSRIEECKRKIDLLWSQSQRLKHRLNIEMTWQEANRTRDPRYQTLFSSSDEESIISLHHARQQNRQQNPPPRESPSSSSSKSQSDHRSSNRDHDINHSAPPQRRFNVTSLSSISKLFFTFRKS